MKRISALFLTAAVLAAVLPALGLPRGAAQLTDTGNSTAGNPENSAFSYAAEYSPVFPWHEPYGTGVGAMPGRVVWVRDPNSVEWDGQDYWWEPEHFNEAAMQRMVRGGIASLAGASDVREGWNALFRANNALRGRQNGYEPGQRIAIKTNMNGAGAYGDDTKGETHESYTNPVILKALLTSLVTDAGTEPGDITVYDAGRVIPDYVRELCSQGVLNGVQFRYRDILGENDAEPDPNTPIVWSQPVSGETNYLPVCVTQADYLINLANLKGHVYGMTLCAKNHFGSIMNSNRMRAPEAAGVHRYLTQNRMDAYTVLVDLMANYQLGEKTMLYMLDAIICAPSESVSITSDNSRWQQAPFNGDFTSSMFFSQDPVAIDSVGADFLMNEPTVTSRNSVLRNNPNAENYLHEAGLVNSAPSGTDYLNGNGERVVNLGVHDHWNNPADKQYSRNLGADEGIELVKIKIGSGETESSGASEGAFETVSGLIDVPANAWYAKAVKYMRDNGLMSRTSANFFEPEAAISRVMLVSILHRQAGSPEVRGQSFSDVSEDAWYGGAVAWASANGIVSGYPDGRFGPDDPLTREQLAVILWQSEGRPAPAGGLHFADQSALSAYAKEAAAWARGRGIISGRDGNRFDPQGTATRAEAAAMLMHTWSR